MVCLLESEMIETKNLSVMAGKKQVLRGVNLKIKDNEIHCIFGPNGSGKTSLALTIIGFPNYKIVKGKIFFNKIELNTKKTNERAKFIGISFQNPPEIRGVKLHDIIKICNEKVDVSNMLKRAFLDESFSSRDINIGFSGGERKRAELAQLFSMKQKFFIFDEIDSGIDIESLEKIGKELKKFLQERKASALVISHYGHILKYLKPDVCHVMVNGRIACSGNYKKIFDQIKKRGYGWCEKCPKVIGK